MKEHSVFISRNMSVNENYSCYDSWIGGMNVSSPVFEMQNSDRSPKRFPLAPFSKTTLPSKWDDAEKWIPSPTSNRFNKGQPREQCGVGSQRNSTSVYGSRQTSIKVVAEVPSEEQLDTKWITSSPEDKVIRGEKLIGSESDAYLIPHAYNKSTVIVKNCAGETAIKLNQHNSSMFIGNKKSFIPPLSTSRSVSMRDMGTEMTPISSREPSRTGTPVRGTTPKCSPISSQTSTPRRGTIVSPNNGLSPNKKELSEKEVQMKTRREIMLLGTQLGKMNIAAWASKEEEDKDASTLLKNGEVEQPVKSVIEKRAAAWEEEEKAKYMARFKREEIKIQAWENHQKAKAEAEMRKIEVEAKRMRSRAHDKLAAAKNKAEKKLAAAESKRSRQAAKTVKQADHIRRTGQIHSSYFCWSWFS